MKHLTKPIRAIHFMVLAFLMLCYWTSVSAQTIVDIKDWRVRTIKENHAGIAYPIRDKDKDVVRIGVYCSKGTRNIFFNNPLFAEFKNNNKMLQRLKNTSTNPILVFNDDYDNEYQLTLGYSKSGTRTGFNRDSKVTLPDGTTLRALKALNVIKNKLLSSKTVWIGYERPDNGAFGGKVYSLSGSTAAIGEVYKIGSCK
ncbi:hypothetical protein N9I81_01875 [Planktomarina temperata]|nr:hypothetical protein [Planktomarina temperata]